MSLITDDENAEAERLAEEERDRIFAQRLRAEAERARLVRQAEAERVRQAMNTLETAPPSVRFDLECQRAVAGTDLRHQQCAAPSLGGQTQANNERIAREVASAERAHAADLASRARWLASEEVEATIRHLEAGQSEENKRLIRAQFFAQKAGG